MPLTVAYSLSKAPSVRQDFYEALM